MSTKQIELAKTNKNISILDRVKSFFGMSMPYIGDETESYGTWQTMISSHSFNRVNNATLTELYYCQNPVVFSIVTQIINASKNIKLVPYRNGKPYKSGVLNLDSERALFNLCTTGTVVFWKRPVIGFGYDLEVIDTVNLTETFVNGVFEYRYQERMKQIKIAESELIFIRMFENPAQNTNFGLSPLMAAIMPNESLREMYRCDTSLLKNKGGDIAISNGTDQPMIGEEDSFDIALQKKIAGSRKYGKAVVTEAKIEVHQLGRTAKELALWDGYKVKIRDICNVYAFPPPLAGDPDSVQYSSTLVAERCLFTNCTMPLLSRIFNNKQLEAELGYTVYLDSSDVEALQESQKEKADKAAVNMNAVLTLNSSVQSGQITKDIAVMILVNEFGYDEQEAQSLIKEPSQQNNVQTQETQNIA
jgi:hypothetical protein